VLPVSSYRYLGKVISKEGTTHFGVIASFEEWSDSHEADLVIPHDDVSTVGRIPRYVERVLEYCPISECCQHYALYPHKQFMSCLLTIKSISSRLVQEAFLLARVGYVSDVV